jgi:hypothetical protein
MTLLAISFTALLYSMYFVEAYRAYKRGDGPQRPKPWIKR